MISEHHAVTRFLRQLSQEDVTLVRIIGLVELARFTKGQSFVNKLINIGVCPLDLAGEYLRCCKDRSRILATAETQELV